MDKLNMRQIEQDVSKQKPVVSGVIDKVGIEDLKIPIQVREGSRILQLQSNVTAMVSLDDPHVRGIHMSRIYLTLHDFLGKQVLDLSAIEALLEKLVESQKGISKKAYLKFVWQWPVKRKALKSDTLEGWR